MTDHPGDQPRRFPRSARLTSGHEYRRVFQKARRSTSNGFTVLFRTGSNSRARLGLAISKKCAYRAVDRNRIKRLIRESFRRRWPDLPALDIVVLCRPAAVRAARRELTAELEHHWRRLAGVGKISP